MLEDLDRWEAAQDSILTDLALVVSQARLALRPSSITMRLDVANRAILQLRQINRQSASGVRTLVTAIDRAGVRHQIDIASADIAREACHAR
jgi:hypothetical protein